MSNKIDFENDESGNKLSAPPPSDLNDKKSRFWNFNYPYSDLIGKGDQAKDSVVWYLITSLVRLASFLIVALMAFDVYKFEGKNTLSILKEVWSVFVPVITLAMGYLFGKSEGQKDKE